MDSVNMADIFVNGIKPEQRELRPRDYIYASEIGYPMFDRYHQMLGDTVSNDFSARTQFKFLIGNALEYFVQRLWMRAGMTVEIQKGNEKCIVQVGNLLPISGRYDAIVSADGDWDRAIWEIQNHPLPEIEFFIDKAALSMAQYCKEKYPDGFPREIIEIKTMNSMVFRSKVTKGILERDYYHHQLQLYTYMVYHGAKTGKVFYISKDDGLFFFVDVVESKKLKKDWLTDIATITKHYREGIEPEFPPGYTFQDGKYKVNWYAVGSKYLTMHTGKTEEEFEKEQQSIVRKLNKQVKEQQKT